MRRFWLGFAYFNLLVAILGTDLWSRTFVKLRIGPFYILDVLFLLIMTSAVLSVYWIPAKQLLHMLWTPLLFFLWGAFLLSIDFIHNYSHLTPYLVSRIAQHAITFVYPLMWVGIGVWAYQTLPQRWIYLLITALVLANALRHFKGEHIANLSLGPLIAIPYVFFLVQAQQDNIQRARRYVYLTSAIFLGVLTCYPFWVMYVTSMQRTTLLILFVTFFCVPWVLVKDSAAIRWRSVALSLVLLFIGIVIMTSWKSIPSTAPSKPLQQAPIVQFALKSFQHGEDVPDAENPRPFQMRTRRFIWKTAIHDWLKNPIFGIGFIPEVPSYMAPGFANNGNYAWPGDPPVSGPHNSYLSILSRMGLVGLILFLIFAIRIGLEARHLISRASVDLMDLFLLFVPLNGAIYAFFNVGFESPHNCMIMWVFSGFLLAREFVADTEFNARSNRP